MKTARSFVAAFLALCLALASPVYAMRSPEPAEALTRAGLEETLSGRPKEGSMLRRSNDYDPEEVAGRLLEASLRLDSLTTQEFFDPKTGMVTLNAEQAADLLNHQPTASGLRRPHKNSRRSLAEEINDRLSHPELASDSLAEIWAALFQRGVTEVRIVKSREVDTQPWTEARLSRAVKEARKKNFSFQPTIVEKGAQPGTRWGKELKKAYSQITRSANFPAYQRSWGNFLEAHGIPPEEVYDGRPHRQRGLFSVYIDLKRDKKGLPIPDKRRHIADLKIGRLDSLWNNRRVRQAETLFIVGAKTWADGDRSVRFSNLGKSDAAGLPVDQFNPADPFRLALEIAVADPRHTVQAARWMDTGAVVYPFAGQVRFYVDPPFKNGRIQKGAFLYRALTQIREEFWKEIAKLGPRALYATHVRTRSKHTEGTDRAYFDVGTGLLKSTSLPFSEEEPVLLTVRIDPKTGEPIQAWHMETGQLVFPRTDILPTGPFRVFVDPQRDPRGLVAAQEKADAKVSSPVWSRIWDDLVRPDAQGVVIQDVSTWEPARSDWKCFFFEGEPFSTAIPQSGKEGLPLQLEFLAQDPARRPQAARRMDTGEVVYPAPGQCRIILDPVMDKGRVTSGRLHKAGYHIRLKSVRSALKAAEGRIAFENLNVFRSGRKVAFRNPLTGKKMATSLAYRPGISIIAVAERKGKRKWTITQVYDAAGNEALPPSKEETAQIKGALRSDKATPAARVLAVERLSQWGALDVPNGVTTDLLQDLLFDYHGEIFNKVGAEPFYRLSSQAARLYRSRPDRYWRAVYGPLAEAEHLPPAQAALHLAAAARSLPDGPSAAAGMEEGDLLLRARIGRAASPTGAWELYENFKQGELIPSLDRRFGPLVRKSIVSESGDLLGLTTPFEIALVEGIFNLAEHDSGGTVEIFAAPEMGKAGYRIVVRLTNDGAALAKDPNRLLRESRDAHLYGGSRGLGFWNIVSKADEVAIESRHVRWEFGWATSEYLHFESRGTSPIGEGMVLTMTFKNLAVPAAAGMEEEIHPIVLAHRERVVQSVAFSPDGQRLISGGGDGIFFWNPVSEKPLLQITKHPGRVHAALFSPSDGGGIVSVGPDTADVHLWHKDGTPDRVLQGHTEPLRCAAFSPDGSLLATGGLDKTIRIWEVKTGRTLQVLQGHTDRIKGLAFSPDGMRLVSGGGEGVVRVWSADGRSLAVLEGHSGGVAAVAFSPNGKILASAATGLGDNAIRLWDQNGNPMGVLQGHENSVEALAFSPDSRFLASGGRDASIRLWDLETGTLWLVLWKHTSPAKKVHRTTVTSLAFSPDGKTLASAAVDGTARLWDLAPVTVGVAVEPQALAAVDAKLEDAATLHLSGPGKGFFMVAVLEAMDALKRTPYATGALKKEVVAVLQKIAYRNRWVFPAGSSEDLQKDLIVLRAAWQKAVPAALRSGPPAAGMEEERRKYRREAFQAMMGGWMTSLIRLPPDSPLWDRLRREGNDPEKAAQILIDLVQAQRGWRRIALRLLGVVLDWRADLRGVIHPIAEEVAWFQEHLDTSAPSFRLEKWAEALLAEEIPVPYESSTQFLERLVWPVEPGFRPLPPRVMRGGTAEERDWFLKGEYLAQVIEQVLRPKGIMVASFRDKVSILSTLGNPEEVTTPAGRRIPLYLVKAPAGTEPSTAAALPSCVLYFGSAEQRFRAGEYPRYRKDWEELQRLLKQGGVRVAIRTPSSKNPEDVKKFLIGWIGMLAFGRHSEEEAHRRHRDVVLAEEKVHSDTRAFGDALVGHAMENVFPEDNDDVLVMTRATVRKGGAPWRKLQDVESEPIEKQLDVARDIRETEAWLGSLRDSQEPAYRFLFIIAPEQCFAPGSQAIRTAEAMRPRLREALFPGTTDDAQWWAQVMQAARDYDGFKRLLRSVAEKILREDFLTIAEREKIIPQPWTPYAPAGMEERNAAMAREMAVAAWMEAPDVGKASVGSPLLVFREPDTFDLVPLAVKEGWTVAVDADGPEVERLGRLLDRMREEGSAAGIYKVGRAQARRLIQGSFEQITIHSRRQAFLLLLPAELQGLPLPSGVAKALKYTRRLLDLSA